MDSKPGLDLMDCSHLYTGLPQLQVGPLDNGKDEGHRKRMKEILEGRVTYM